MTNVIELIASLVRSHASSKDLPQATAILSFFQLISGVVGLSISQNLFIGGLKTQLKPYNLPSETILAITGSVEVSCDTSTLPVSQF